MPVSALIALWAFALVLTVGPAIDLRNASSANERAATPAQTLISELQQERRLSALNLAGAEITNSDLLVQRQHTDAAMNRFRELAESESLRKIVSARAKQDLEKFQSDFGGMAAVRADVDLGWNRAGVISWYTAFISLAFDLRYELSNVSESSVDREARAVISISMARELLSRQDALVASTIQTGQVAVSDQNAMVEVIGTLEFFLPDAAKDLSTPAKQRYNDLIRSDAYIRVNQINGVLLSQSWVGGRLPISAAEWRNASASLLTQLTALEDVANQHSVKDSRRVGDQIMLEFGLATVVGLAAIVVAIYLSLRLARTLVRRLTTLQSAAQELAGERLPGIIGRLRKGEDVDVNVEAPPLDLGTDELGKVAEAFNKVQRSAISSAVEEVNVRRGLNDVFLNIARRSQTLLHRQLSMLDEMERRTTEPDDLERLFRVDHLATRMRRHAEDLVILAGAAPGRGWRMPVPVIDVVRGALSEVEEYARVNVEPLPDESLAGRAVGDIIHLLAELLENATSYSPPDTPIRVTGELVPRGLVLEIEDRGLGMTEEAINEANAKLLDPPEFDPTNSARLGLFVVAQLANRHDIRVHLRTSAYGGITAIVLVPTQLVDGYTPPAPELEDSDDDVFSIDQSTVTVATEAPATEAPDTRTKPPRQPANATEQPVRQPVARQPEPTTKQPEPAAKRPESAVPQVKPMERQPAQAADRTGRADDREEIAGRPAPQRMTGRFRQKLDPAAKKAQAAKKAEQAEQAQKAQQAQKAKKAEQAKEKTEPTAKPTGSRANTTTRQTVEPSLYTGIRPIPDAPALRMDNWELPRGRFVPTPPVNSAPPEPARTTPPAVQPPAIQPPAVQPPAVRPATAPDAWAESSRVAELAFDNTPPEDGSTPRLPRRVRQANLAPQLRDAQQPQATEAAPVATERSAEQARTRMSSFQAGTFRARQSAASANITTESADTVSSE